MQHMIVFFACQVLTWLATQYSIREEIHFTYPFREFSWPGDLEAHEKPHHSRLAHRAGAGFILVITFAIAFAVGGYYNIVWMWILFTLFYWILLLCIYWLFFDIGYALGINKEWDYVGDTSTMDGWVLKTFGDKPGRNKAIACVLLIIIFNLLYLFVW